MQHKNSHSPGFILWRQDDHGNRYQVGRYDSRQAAEHRMTELTRTQHKQTYWIEQLPITAPCIEKKNLYRNIPACLPEELLEVLCANRYVRIERILSRGQASAPDFWYDQESDEFVLLVRGRATLEFDDGSAPVNLEPGDWLNIPAHTRHRVSWTDPEQDNIWLAVHSPDKNGN